MGDSHPDVGQSLHGLAGIFAKQRRPDEAKKLYEQAINILKSSLGSSHPDVAIATENFEYFQKFQTNTEQEKFAVIEKPDETGATTAAKGGWAILGLGLVTTAAYYFLKKQ